MLPLSTIYVNTFQPYTMDDVRKNMYGHLEDRNSMFGWKLVRNIL